MEGEWDSGILNWNYVGSKQSGELAKKNELADFRYHREKINVNEKGTFIM